MEGKEENQKEEEKVKEEVKEEELIIGHCYCGQFKFSIPLNLTPITSVYCHCDSCRRSHSCSLYSVIYIDKNYFHILEGNSLIQEFRKEDANVIRSFCKNCGTRLYNKLLHREGWIGVFPNLFSEEIQRQLPHHFKPTLHLHCNESIIDLEKFHDDLQRVIE